MAQRFFLQGHPFPVAKPAPGLYVAATPIGHLKDITLRALEVLAGADAILAEDTRVTRVLLQHYGIETPLLACHDHNEERIADKVIARLAAGEALALVSDAGTPLLSDPGYALVRAVIGAGHALVPLPGASALLGALVVAGLPTEKFYFEGFLPPKSGERRRRLAALAGIATTLVFYESPHRVVETLADMAATFGARPVVLAREITKKFETIRRALLPELAAQLAQEGPPKGEIVLLVGPATGEETQTSDAVLVTALHEALRMHSPRDAVALVAAALSVPRKRVYALALGMGTKPLGEEQGQE